MRWFSLLAMRLRMLFSRGPAASQLDDELSFHLDRQVAENIAAGMTPAQARAAALRSFGNTALLRDQTRATWNWSSLESLLRDIRYSVRTLVRTPGFALIAILVMALGIGANVALFTIVHSVLLKPLPFQNPARLIAVYERNANDTGPRRFLPVDAGSFGEWQKAAQGMAEMAMVSPFQGYNVSAESGKLPEGLDAAWCSGNFFSLLGIQPALGRTFNAADDQPGAQATVILSATLWHRRYGADPAIE